MTAGQPPEKSDLYVCLARLEAKLDVAIAQQGAKIEQVDAVTSDHEERLRSVEQRDCVSTRALWSAVIGVSTVVAAFGPYLRALFVS